MTVTVISTVTSGYVVSAGDEADIVPGGSIVSGTVLSAGDMRVSSGGSTLGVVVSGGGEQDVVGGYTSGTHVLTLFSQIGSQTVASGGIAVDTVLESTGYLLVSSGGTASGTTTVAYTTIDVTAGGVLADASIVGTDTHAEIASGGLTTGGVVAVGGVVNISSGGSGSDLTIAQSGGLNLLSGGAVDGLNLAGDGAATIDGLLDLRSGNVFNGASAFVQSNGVVNVSGGASVPVVSAVDGTVNLLTGFTGPVAVYGGGGLLDVGSGAVLSSGTVSLSTVHLESGSVVSGTVFGPIGYGTIENSGGSEFDHNTLSAGYHLHIDTGAVASGTTVGANADETVAAGGSAMEEQVDSAGTIIVSSGGIVSGLNVASGGGLVDYGEVTLRAGDVLHGVQVGSFGTSTPGGTLNVVSGSIIEGSVGNFGVINLLSGASGVDLAIGGYGIPYYQKGILNVSSGASIGSSIAEQGLIIFGSGVVSSSVFFDGIAGNGFSYWLSGSEADGSILHGFAQYIEEGAVASGTIVGSGGYEAAGGGSFGVNGGQSISASVESGGDYDAYAGGVATGTIVHSGAYASSYDGGIFLGIVVEGGGYVDVDSAGLAIDTVLSSGALMEVYGGDDSTNPPTSGGLASHTSVFEGATVYVYSGGQSVDTVLLGGEVIVESSGFLTVSASSDNPDSGVIDFYLEPATIEIDGAVGPAAVITEFGSNDEQRIDLTGIGAFVHDYDYTIGANDRVTFSGTSGTITLTIDGATASGGFILSDDGEGGIFVAPGEPAPSVALDAASDSGVVGDNVTFVSLPTLTGSGTAGEVVTLSEGSTVLGSTTVALDGTWSFTVASAFADGVHTITVGETNSGSLPLGASRPLTLTVDTSTPDAPTGIALAPQSDTGVLGDDLTGLASPAITGSGTAGDTVVLYENGSPIGSALVGEDGTWSITPAAPLADGEHLLRARQVTLAGNTGDADDLTITVDTTVPAAPSGLALDPASDTGALGDGATRVAQPTITGSGIAGDTIVVFDGETAVGSATVDPDGAWSVTPAAPLAVGGHAITARQESLAGVLSEASPDPAFTLTIEPLVVPPLAELALAPADDSGALGDGVTRVTAPAIIGTGTPGALVTVIEGDAVIGTATVGEDGQFSVMPTAPLAAGLHTLALVQSEGDLASAPTAFALTIDTDAPAAPTLSQSAIATPAGRPLLVGTAPANATVALYDGDALLGTATADAGGAYSFQVETALATGGHALTARATDAAGNASAASPTLTVTIAGDGAYQAANAPDADGNTAVFAYHTDGSLSAADTYDPAHLLLQHVDTGVTIRNIYDRAGTLIGTVSGPGSANGVPPQPDFATARAEGGAATATDSGASVVTLLAEQNDIALQGRDTVFAGAGQTTISAATAAVLVAGGAGALTFVGGSGASTVLGGAGSTTVLGGTGGGSYAGGRAGGNVLAAGGGATTLYAAGEGDALFGSKAGQNGQDLLVGSAAHQFLVGGAGAATLVGAAGNLLFGGDGAATLFGHQDASGTNASGTNASGTNASLAGTTTLVGGAGDAVMVAGRGDLVFAGHGASTLFGAAASAGGGGNTMVGDASDASRTLMLGGAGADLIAAGGGASTIFGGAGDDTILAGSGSMLAVLGAGQDEVYLGHGAATVFAGSGADLFAAFASDPGGHAVIAGFKLGADRIALGGYDAAAVANATAAQTNAGGNTTLTLADNTTITILGVTHLTQNSVF